MGELITAEQPRIKFDLQRVPGSLSVTESTQLQHLADLMRRMELVGAAPVLNDLKVGGNCAITYQYACGGHVLNQSAATERSQQSDGVVLPGTSRPQLLVSRSGKQPGALLGSCDWVAVHSFSRETWSAVYQSAANDVNPSSDSPLLCAALSPSAAAEYGWTSGLPCVALHGHALAEGAGLKAAAEMLLPISEHETLFSTPEDLAELEALFRAHPYPEHRCFIRKGHGFFILGPSVEDVRETFKTYVEPVCRGCRV